MKILTKNLKNKSEFGLVIDWSFHKKNRWVSIFTPYFVDAYIRTFKPLIIRSQPELNLFKNQLKYILSMEPGWAAPKLKYTKNQLVALLASDPHNKTDWFQEYVEKNNITYILSQYNSPFFFHFPNFPKEKFIHFPWAVPDEFISKKRITINNNDVMIFGGKTSDAYDVRNWCRLQDNIICLDNSGVENKALSDREYFDILSSFDAIIAAGSSKPQYDLVTPKYFEIASTGALLVGQKCKDLEILGFNENNSLIFSKENFNTIIEAYRKNPYSFIKTRSEGRKLIFQKHLISNRINKIRSIFNQK